MKKILSLVIIIAVVLVAIVTCPDKQAHQDAVMAEMNGAIDSAIKESRIRRLRPREESFKNHIQAHLNGTWRSFRYSCDG